MSRNIRRLLFLAALLLAPAVSAQQSATPTEPRNGRIYLDVVVTQKSGLPVSGLQQRDFAVLDNKVSQTITSFQAVEGRQVPVDVIVVVDAVNAGYITVAHERDQIDKFLRTEGGDLTHATSLAVLTDTGIDTLKDFSKDGNMLSSLLDRYVVSLRSLRRSSVYGADDRFQISLQGLRDLAQHEASLPGRKIMIWVSPGWPLLSGQLDTKEQQQLFGDIMDLSTVLLRDHITLYNIDPLGTGEGLERALYWQGFVKEISKPSQVLGPGNLGLQVLATQSGGLVLSNNNDIAALLQNCLADTRAYYEISFDPPTGERPDEYHHLEVRIAQHGLTARTRQGYYSLPESRWRPIVPTPVETGNPRENSR